MTTDETTTNDPVTASGDELAYDGLPYTDDFNRFDDEIGFHRDRCPDCNAHFHRGTTGRMKLCLNMCQMSHGAVVRFQRDMRAAARTGAPDATGPEGGR